MNGGDKLEAKKKAIIMIIIIIILIIVNAFLFFRCKLEN